MTSKGRETSRACETGVERRLLDIKGLAVYMSLSVQTIRNKLSAGTFPICPIRIGRKLLWDKRAVDAYISKKSSKRNRESEIDLSAAGAYHRARKGVMGLPASAFLRKERGL